MRAARERKVEEILRYLNAKRVRATYSAVGGVIGVPAQSVGQYLGKPRPEASWVVRKKDGKPTGYASGEKHADLFHTPCIIHTGDALDDLLRQRPE